MISNNINSSYTNITNNLNKNEEVKGNSVLAKIAATKEVTAQDASTLAIVDSLRMQQDDLTQGIVNANDAAGMLQIADSAMQNASDGVAKLDELNVRMNSGILNSEQQSMLQKEADGIKASIQDGFNNASFNGQSVFGGEREFNVGGGSMISASLSNLKTEDLKLNDTESMDRFREALNDQRSSVGSAMNQITSSVRNNANGIVNLAGSRSQLEDANMAEKTNELDQQKLQKDAALFANAHQTQMLELQVSRLLGA